MHLSIPLAMFAQLLVLAVSTPMDLAPVPVTADLEERSAAVCATCVGQCVAWLGLCTAVCGPWAEIFTGPLPCTVSPGSLSSLPSLLISRLHHLT